MHALVWLCVYADAALMGMGVVGLGGSGSGSGSCGDRLPPAVLSDFDLRPPWAFAVALKEVVREEMRKQWHAVDANSPAAAAAAVAAAAAAAAAAEEEEEADDAGAAAQQQQQEEDNEDRMQTIRETNEHEPGPCQRK